MAPESKSAVMDLDLSKLGMSELRSAGRDCGVNFAELRTRPQLIGCALT